MKLKNILFVVNDIEQSKQFYCELFGLHVIADFDTNVILSEGLVLQEKKNWQSAIEKAVHIGGHDAELYFEENDLERFQRKLEESDREILILSRTEHIDGRRIIRLYDPDMHVIEVSESYKANQSNHSLSSSNLPISNSYFDYVVAIDIGGTSAKYAYVSENGSIECKGVFETGIDCTRQEFLGKLHSVVKQAYEDGVRMVGISSLGTFDTEGKCLGNAENLPILLEMNVAKEICMKYPEMTCHVMNDGNAAAMGEYWVGEAVDCDNFICLTLGTGIGGAVVLNGEPLLGGHYLSGEIGYTNYVSDTEYLEKKYSTVGVLKEAAKRLGISEIGGIEFVERVKQNDKICVEIFAEWVEALAGVIANMVLVIDPEKVIIGGGISGQKDWLCGELKEKLQHHLPVEFRDKVKVCIAKNGNDAGILGAAGQYFT